MLGLLFLGVLGTAGCGGSDLIEVQGTVTLNGKPIPNVQVEFLPDPEQGFRGPRSEAVTDKEGHFTLSCDNGHRGAVPGTHRVLVTDLARWEDISVPGGGVDYSKAKPSRLPAKYGDTAKTPLRNIEVKPGGGPIKLLLTSR